LDGLGVGQMIEGHEADLWAHPLRLKSLSAVYALVPRRWAAKDVLSATAARMSAFNAFSLILSPSWKSMARLVLSSRLELKRPCFYVCVWPPPGRSLPAMRILISTAAGVVLAALTGCDRNPPPSTVDTTTTTAVVVPSQPPPVGGTITQEAKTDWSVLLHEGKYRVINNVWNKGIAEGVFRQKVFLERLDGKETFGWQWSWPRGKNVMAYPEVVYGDKPWDPPSGLRSGFPFQVSSKKIAVRYDVRLTATGTYALAFTLWGISDTNQPKGSITHEIMIWSANRGGTPAGTRRGALLVRGVNFDVYVNPHQSDNSGASQSQWTYVAFVAQTPQLKGQFDLNAMTDYLLKEEIMTKNIFLTSLELGTEISGGEGTVEFLDYAVTVASK
jgi:hypothetical protein